jgi:hypothetical protein
MTPAAILEIISLVSQTLPAAEAIITNAIAAFNSNDQASLDKARAQALALANAVRPAGTPPLT